MNKDRILNLLSDVQAMIVELLSDEESTVVVTSDKPPKSKTKKSANDSGSRSPKNSSRILGADGPELIARYMIENITGNTEQIAVKVFQRQTPGVVEAVRLILKNWAKSRIVSHHGKGEWELNPGGTATLVKKFLHDVSENLGEVVADTGTDEL